MQMQTIVTTTLEEEINTPEEILELLFSTIAYLRNFFPSSHFSVKSLGSSHVRLLQPNCENSIIYISWYKEGILDTIVKEYLSKFVIGVYNESGFLETYTFEIVYDKQCFINIMQTLRTLTLLVQTLNQLPAEKFITVRLYYNERVPFDYEPRGFKPATLNECVFVSDSIKLDLNEFKANKWKFIAYINSTLDKSKSKNQYSQISNTNNHSINNSQIPQTQEIFTQRNEEIPHTPKKLDLVMKNTIKSEIKPRKTVLCVDSEIKCICGINITDSDMLQCGHCEMWLHTVCCGFFTNTDKRIPAGEYKCMFCDKQYTDDLRRLALFRRVLSIIYNEDLSSIKWLASRVGVSINVAKNIVTRLESEEFVKRRKCKYGLTFDVTKDSETKEKIKRYFTLGLKKLRMSVPIRDIKA